MKRETIKGRIATAIFLSALTVSGAPVCLAAAGETAVEPVLAVKDVFIPPKASDVRLGGYVGARLDRCLEQCVMTGMWSCQPVVCRNMFCSSCSKARTDL